MKWLLDRTALWTWLPVALAGAMLAALTLALWLTPGR